MIKMEKIPHLDEIEKIELSNLDKFKILMAMDAHYMPSEYDGDMFHYTSPQGFQSILFGDRFDTVLWASRYDCLNDASEGTKKRITDKCMSYETDYFFYGNYF